MRVIGAILMIAASASAAAQNPKRSLEPDYRWQLDFGESQCVAARSYDAANKAVTFAIRPSANGKTVELLLSDQRSGPRWTEQLKGKVDFGSGELPLWLLRTRNDAGKALFVYRLTAERAEGLSRASQIMLDADQYGRFNLRLTDMGKLMPLMQTCLADLRRHWNAEGATGGAKAVIATPSKGSLHGIFEPGDFPNDALTRGQDGAVQFLLLIDETGKIANCSVSKTSGIAVLDGMGCQVLLERARFSPALDAAGKPVRSTLVTPIVTWRTEGF